MLPEWRKGWHEGAWAGDLEGREKDVPPDRTVCGGPGSARQAGALGGWWAGRCVTRFPPQEIFLADR